MIKHLTIILIIISNIALTQNNEYQLAYEYYRNHEYDKAAELYKSLYEKTNSSYYFSVYTQCLIELKNFDAAEKIIKKKIKQNKTNLQFYVDLGHVYKSKGDNSKAEKTFETAIKKLQPNRQQIINLANAFVSKRYYKWAEKTYLRGEKILKQKQIFAYELANVYLYQRDYEKMINNYLSLLEISPTYIASVQSRLQSIVYNSKDDEIDEIFRKNLLKKIQENPNNNIFSELLIWYYLQKKEFDFALTQAKAIDKRNKEEGERILSIANTASNNFDYKTAVKAYRYIIKQYGKKGRYYFVAKNKYCKALFHKINEQQSNKQELIKLNKILQETINELGINKTSFDLLIIQAKLKGLFFLVWLFYL